jgi:hypothetical protein
LPRYEKPVWQMIEDIKSELPPVFAPKDVIVAVKKKYPKVQDVTIRCQLFGLTPNHPSSKYYPSNRKSFEYLGNGRFRLAGSGSLEEQPLPIPVEELSDNTDEQFTFSFESDLEDHIVRNLNDLEEGLTLYQEGEERTGQQYVTDVGRIDLLAKDKNGNFVVIELKMHGFDKTCGQILRYMGWVKHHLAKNQDVRGIIVTGKADDQLKYAASVVRNIKIKEYKVEFTFNDANLSIE